MRSSALLFLITLSFAAGQQAPASQAVSPDEEKKFASIDGKLTDAATGEPVRKANVVLMQMPSQSGAVMTGPPPSTATSTGAEGQFSFSKVEPGRYMLSAEKAGYVRQQYGSRSGQFGPGTNLTVEAGQKLSNLDFRLTRQAVITGKVVDEDGEPVPNAMVSVLRQAPFSPQPMNMMGMPANDVGEFRIANLVPGRYFIRAEFRGGMFGAVRQTAAADGEGTLGYVATYFPGAIDAASAASVTVAAGQQISGIDIRLRKARVYQVTGKVQGAPTGGRLQVTLQPQRQQGQSVAYHFGGGGPVKPDGSFIVTSVQPGAYEAVAMSIDSGRPQTLGRTPVTVANTNVEGLVIQAGTPLEVTGQVIQEGESQSKLTGQVSLQPVERIPAFTPPARIQEDGSFKISGVSRDKFYVTAFGIPGDLYVKTVTAGNVDVTETGLDLSKLDAAPPLEIRLSAKGAAVEGVVTDGDKPAPGAVVMLLPHPFVPDRPVYMRKTATTDQNGRFSIKGIAPGDYRAYAWDSYLPMQDLDPEQLKQFDKFAVTVRLKEEAREQVQLKLAQVKAE